MTPIEKKSHLLFQTTAHTGIYDVRQVENGFIVAYVTELEVLEPLISVEHIEFILDRDLIFKSKILSCGYMPVKLFPYSDNPKWHVRELSPSSEHIGLSLDIIDLYRVAKNIPAQGLNMFTIKHAPPVLRNPYINIESLDNKEFLIKCKIEDVYDFGFRGEELRVSLVDESGETESVVAMRSSPVGEKFKAYSINRNQFPFSHLSPNEGTQLLLSVKLYADEYTSRRWNNSYDELIIIGDRLHDRFLNDILYVLFDPIDIGYTDLWTVKVTVNQLYYVKRGSLIFKFRIYMGIEDTCFKISFHFEDKLTLNGPIVRYDELLISSTEGAISKIKTWVEAIANTDFEPLLNIA